MRLLSKTAAAIPRVNWRSRENLLPLMLFLAVIGVIAAIFLLHSRVTTFHIFQLGYIGVALSALLASGGLIVPVPALAAVCVASLFLFPLLVGVVAGAAERWES